jgi:hypothetical protein
VQRIIDGRWLLVIISQRALPGIELGVDVLMGQRTAG